MSSDAPETHPVGVHEARPHTPAETGLARVMEGIRPEPLRQRTAIRLMLLVVMLSTTIGGWQLVREWEKNELANGMEKLRTTLESRWAETNIQCLQPPRTLCDELDNHQITTAEQFVRRATKMRQTLDVYEGLYWVGADGTRKAGVGGESDVGDTILPFGTDIVTWRQLQRAASGAGPIVGPVYEGNYGRSLVLLYFPLGEDGNNGAVVAILRISRLIEHFADSDVRELAALELVRNDRSLYRTGNYMATRNPELARVARLRMLDQVWQCQITPTFRFTRQYDSQTSQLILVVGIVGSLIASASVVEAMKRRWQHTMLEKGHVQIIDIMGELTRSISTSRGGSGDSLVQIVDTARPVTESDAVAVYQISQNRRQLGLLCGAGDITLPKTINLDGLAAEVLRPVIDGRMLISDQTHMRDVASALGLFNSGSLRTGVIAPLQLGRVTGVMVFGAISKAAWSEGRVALVKLWASQTAALLGDEAIHSQMRDALSVQEKLARRREMMLNLLGEIYQAGTVEQTLGRIAHLSPPALGIEACVVALRTRKEGEFEVVAATGELGARYFGARLLLSGQQHVRLFKSESVAVIQPAELALAGLDRIAEPWLAGLAAIPMLHSDQRPIGCLLLMSADHQAFTADQLDLARVLASRAAAAIENAHLNQQIRRDAETRAMLLRELNHRVKNNLAGIVGLLSMSSNMEMPENVRQWLDRVIERIGNIARAHELFSGGMQSVSLPQLVEQVIPSLAVVKPPGVMICKDLGPTEIRLKTTQAVSLAMVIHELCYNAIVHGLGARGTLTIQARILQTHQVLLEIIDDGTAGMVQTNDDGSIATMAPPASSTGLGLRLVKGLVGRELRGRFTMRRRPEGGTVVGVEFPLERDREEGDNGR